MMKKNLVAIAVMMAASQVSAVELYDEAGTSAKLGGWIDGNIASSGQDGDPSAFSKDGYPGMSSRFNLGFEQRINRKFTAEALAEWQITSAQGATLKNRLAYLGVNYDTKGQHANIRIGSQWAPIYDIAGVADLPVAFGSDVAYDSALGYGRVDNMLAYHHDFLMDGDNKVSLSAGYIGGTEEIQNVGGTPSTRVVETDPLYQFTLAYSTEEFMLGLGYSMNGGEYGSNETDNDSFVFGASYGQYAKGLFVSGAFSMRNSTQNNNDYDQTGMEFLVAYAVDDVNYVVNYQDLSDDDTSSISSAAIQVEYALAQDVTTYVGYKMDLRDEDEGDAWALGIRYAL